jgi:hypothetical protein
LRATRITTCCGDTLCRYLGPEFSTLWDPMPFDPLLPIRGRPSNKWRQFIKIIGSVIRFYQVINASILHTYLLYYVVLFLLFIIFISW